MLRLIPCLFMFMLFSCKTEKRESHTFPKEGEICYRTVSEKGAEFIHLKVHSDSVYGTIFVTEEVNGQVYYNFKGKIDRDSILQLDVMYTPEPISQRWTFHFRDSILELSNSLERRNTIEYHFVSCSAMPTISEYSSVHDIDKEDAAEASENRRREGDYYESVMESKSANQRITMREFLEVINKNGQITGKGAGESEGDSSWTFSFNGNIADDSIVTVEINYKVDTSSAYKVSEKWIYNSKTNKIKVKSWDSTHLGALQYRKVDFNDIPEFYQKLLEH